MSGVKRCGNCDHPVYRHEPDDLELCRIEGCRCPGFLTVRKPKATIREAIAMVRFAHHEHAFGDEHCTPSNCSVAAFLDVARSQREPLGLTPETRRTATGKSGMAGGNPESSRPGRQNVHRTLAPQREREPEPRAIQRYTLTPDDAGSRYLELDPDGRWCLFEDVPSRSQREPDITATPEWQARLRAAVGEKAAWDVLALLGHRPPRPPKVQAMTAKPQRLSLTRELPELWRDAYRRIAEQYAVFLERYDLAEDSTAEDIIAVIQDATLDAARSQRDPELDRERPDERLREAALLVLQSQRVAQRKEPLARRTAIDALRAALTDVIP